MIASGALFVSPFNHRFAMGLKISYAIKKIARGAHSICATAGFSSVILLLCACSTSAPAVRPTVYDFGPENVVGTVVAIAVVKDPSGSDTRAVPVVLPAFESAAALDGNAVLYRLLYADAQQLRPYALARWSAPPAQLVHQHLRERLSAERAVLGNSDTLAPVSGAALDTRWVLYVSLEEFSQVFDSPSQSAAQVRAHATLMRASPAGDVLVAQRVFSQRQGAPSADAAGGVRALTAASSALAQQVAVWLATMNP